MDCCDNVGVCRGGADRKAGIVLTPGRRRGYGGRARAPQQRNGHPAVRGVCPVKPGVAAVWGRAARRPSPPRQRGSTERACNIDEHVLCCQHDTSWNRTSLPRVKGKSIASIGRYTLVCGGNTADAPPDHRGAEPGTTADIVGGGLRHMAPRAPRRPGAAPAWRPSAAGSRLRDALPRPRPLHRPGGGLASHQGGLNTTLCAISASPSRLAPMLPSACIDAGAGPRGVPCRGATIVCARWLHWEL